MPIFIGAVAGLVALSVAASPPARPPRLSDADLVRFASSRFDPYARTGRIRVLGVHRGTLVVVDYPCGDVCPAYTRRIAHYDAPPEACARVGGTIVNELVPRGPAVMPRPYCEPTVIVGVKPKLMPPPG
ncbi:MAG: hypothetical protein QOK17_1476 [Sphingomonadales bacterium]|jgi:hypothetical protein|nr:hypothetical protein [Sphingomonadales bacterium]